MTITRKALCTVYGFIGLVALAGTWGNNLPYLQSGFVGGTARFWQETLANPASRSITVDVKAIDVLGLSILALAFSVYTVLTFVR